MRTFILSALLLACSSSEKTGEGESEADLDPGVDESCDEDSDCASHEICEDSDCIDGDRSNGFTEAVDVNPAESSSDEDNIVSGHINVEDDKDYWRYASTGEEFITAKISNENFASTSEEGGLSPDLYLTLYDPDGAVVTSADDYPNGDSVNNYDSVLFAYLRRAGDYILVVEDANKLNNRGEKEDYENLYGEGYPYSMVLLQQSGTNDLESSLEEPLLRDNSGSTGMELATKSWRSIGVLIDEPGEVDYVAVLFDNDNLTTENDLDPEGNLYTWDQGLFTVAGLRDLRGSDATPYVQIYSPDDEIVSTGVDVGPAQTMKYGALTQGQYILALSDAEGGGGPNHWFYVLLLGENQGDNIPFEEEENGTSALANPIETTEITKENGQRFSQGSVQGFVNSEGDNDWFTISAPEDATGDNSEGKAAQWVVLCANSQLWGSSATPTVRIYDSAGSTIGEAVSDGEGEPNVRIENIEIEPGEELTIQVDAGVDSEGAPDEWYRMKVFIAGFEVKSYENGGYVCP